MAKSAMAKDPPNLTRVSPGVYRNPQGKLVNKLPGQKAAGEHKKRNGNKGVGLPGAEPGSVENKFRKLPKEGQTDELRSDVGAFANNMFANAMQYDPNRPFQGYEQPFSQEMSRARESVMGEFNRTMQPEFERQDAEFNQRMLEQGIDPNSGAYQNQYRAMKEAQGQARQSAMSNAFQLGSSYQQQGFGQGLQANMLPFQQYQATENLWALPYQTEAASREAEANRKAQIEAARMGGGSNVTAAQIAAAAQRDVAAMGYAQNWQGQPKPNPWAAAIGGIAQGAGAVVANNYLKGK